MSLFPNDPNEQKLTREEERVWQQAEEDVVASIKQHLIKTRPTNILKKFQSRIASIVSIYLRKLPSHVITSEADDLSNLARIEFLESLRAWDPLKREDPWPLAMSRITGAMRDHLRYLTKADPSRVYDWVTSAAYIYMTVNNSSEFEHKIERGIQLKMAMEQLGEQERKVVVWHYKHDRTFKEIGEKIGLSESQVSRIYKAAIERMKKAMAPKN